jgi:hypothetical protein
MQSCLAAIIIKRGIVDSDTCYSYVAAHCEGLGPDEGRCEPLHRTNAIAVHEVDAASRRRAGYL